METCRKTKSLHKIYIAETWAIFIVLATRFVHASLLSQTEMSIRKIIVLMMMKMLRTHRTKHPKICTLVHRQKKSQKTMVPNIFFCIWRFFPKGNSFWSKFLQGVNTMQYLEWDRCKISKYFSNGLFIFKSENFWRQWIRMP